MKSAQTYLQKDFSHFNTHFCYIVSMHRLENPIHLSYFNSKTSNLGLSSLRSY